MFGARYVQLYEYYLFNRRQNTRIILPNANKGDANQEC